MGLIDSLPPRGESLGGFKPCSGVRGVQNGQRRSGTRYGGAIGISVLGVATEGRAAGEGIIAARPGRVGRLGIGGRETQPTLFEANSELYRETWALSPTMRPGVLGARKIKAAPDQLDMRQTGAASKVGPLSPPRGQLHLRARRRPWPIDLGNGHRRVRRPGHNRPLR